MSSYIRIAISYVATMNNFLYSYLPLETQHMSQYLQQVIAESICNLFTHLLDSTSLSKKSKQFSTTICMRYSQCKFSLSTSV